MVNINKALLHPAGGHQGSHKARQAGNRLTSVFLYFLHSRWKIFHYWLVQNERLKARPQCKLAQPWPNVGTTVPTLGQRWATTLLSGKHSRPNHHHHQPHPPMVPPKAPPLQCGNICLVISNLLIRRFSAGWLTIFLELIHCGSLTP